MSEKIDTVKAFCEHCGHETLFNWDENDEIPMDCLECREYFHEAMND